MNKGPREQERITGFVNSVLFSNDSNGYKVLDLESEDGLELITAVGIMPDVEVGEKIEALGKWEQHSTYGEQFSVSEYYRSVPDDIESMQRYLGSGVIKGVGEALAKKIVDTFGEETFRILDSEPERLSVIKGISDRKACEIAEQFAAKAASREAMVYLQGLGLTPTMSMRVYEVFGSKTISTISTNPYLMAEKVDGISFRKADEIATKNGLPMDSPARIRSAIRFVLMEAAGAGHTFLPRDVMEEWLFQAIGIGGQMVDNAYEQALMSGAIVSRTDEDEREDVYLRAFFTAETKTARGVADLLSITNGQSDQAEADKREREVGGRIEKIEKKLKISLSDEQRSAVTKGYLDGMVIITGGPGTGKTTIIQVLLELLEQDGASYALAAPTGKAAKRMEEATGMEARTIHRLLEVQASAEDESERMVFSRNEEHPLEYSYVIIDEMSMVDVVLMSHLLRAVVPGTHLVLLGDQDQLPSVGAGNVLRDLIASGAVPVCRLTHIYRQTGDSGIVRNAHRINDGEYPVFDNRNTDFFLMREGNAEAVVKTLVDVIKVRFRKFYQCDPIEDMQVLSPMKKGILGVRSLNQQLQEALNPPARNKKEHRSGEVLYRVGDKVMQTRNNYEMEWRVLNKYKVPVEEGKGVFNGDTGRITAIDQEGITVLFDGLKEVTYDFSTVAQLDLAYAITIHKSQGTETPVVVLPLLEGPDVLMTRNLLYTAVTRARKYVVIIGKEETIRHMVDQNRQAIRYSALAERLREAASEFDLLERTVAETAGSFGKTEDKRPKVNGSPAARKRSAVPAVSIDEISHMMGYDPKEAGQSTREDGASDRALLEDVWPEMDMDWPDMDLGTNEFDPDIDI